MRSLALVTLFVLCAASVAHLLSNTSIRRPSSVESITELEDLVGRSESESGNYLVIYQIFNNNCLIADQQAAAGGRYW